MMGAPLILEFGSQSLKVHYQSERSGVFRKARFSWDLGHEVYSTGKISERTARTALDTIQALRERGFNPRNLLAIATGALRDARNAKQFLALLADKLGVDVRVISGQEEASLLAHGYLQQSTELPAMIADIGGGSLEIVYLGKDRTILRDSLPLGAIRLYHLGLEVAADPRPAGAEGSSWNEALVTDFIQGNLEEASLITAGEVITTGGTGKALAKLLGKPEFSQAELEAHLAELRANGPPADLKPDRARVFLPGVLALYRLLLHTRASRLRYLRLPAGRIFLERLARRAGGGASHPQRKRFMLRDMHITSIYSDPKLSGILPAPEKPAQGDVRNSLE